MKSQGQSLLRSYRETLRRLVLAAMFLTIGLVLPFFTGQIQQIGNMLLPMHIPVLLCGLLCGWQYGALIGAILPLLRFVLFGMPVLYPNGLAMSVELCVYGLAIGFIYGMFKKQGLIPVYISLVIAMILGRIVWGGSMTVLLSMQDNTFTSTAFLSGAVLNAIPGIILQLLLIPAIMTSLHATGVQRFNGQPVKEDRL
ncbi:MAG: ECF transporter S component [Clostridia bacterium]|nr:ECF transporter S component [Clostridia bacterium]